MKNLNLCLKQGIVALIPTYKEMKGDSTKILTGENQEYLIYKNIKRVVKVLANKELLDLRESNKHYGGKLGCKNLVPIPLNQRTILIPIKTRKAINKNDSSFSYINLKYIEEILEDRRNGIIILKDRREIITKQRLATIEKHIRNGRIVEEIINKESANIVMENDLFEEYNRPATRGDILELRNELLKLKRILNK